MQAEISYDSGVMESGDVMMKGAFRLPNDEWQAFACAITSVDGPTFGGYKLSSGKFLFCIRWPNTKLMNKQNLSEMLGDYLGVTEWVEVDGRPDLNH